MPIRGVALLLLLAVLPTAELVEQVEHLIEHVMHGDAPNHSAHHDEAPGDEHGCTGLVHLCASNHALVTAAVCVELSRSVIILASLPAREPPHLVDLNSLEPPHRPPIG